MADHVPAELGGQRLSTPTSLYSSVFLLLRLRRIVVDLSLLRDFVHRDEVERENVDWLLVTGAHARIEKALRMLVSTVVVQAGMVIRAAHRLAPCNLNIDRKVLVEEPSAEPSRDSTRNVEWHHTMVIPDLLERIFAPIDAALRQFLPRRDCWRIQDMDIVSVDLAVFLVVALHGSRRVQ